ncbi:MAG: 50S ribosomal protein L4 [Alphaproteobacteria bacterium]
MKLAVKNFENESVGEISLAQAIFGLPSRPDILHRMIRWQQAKARSGNHQTKEIWAVSGTTRKPHKQKGTGRARQGSLRGPHMRGGAVVFGPHKRDHSFDLPKKVRKLALRTALSAKYAAGKLVIVDSLSFKSMKAKELAVVLEKNQWTSPLFIDGVELNTNFQKASQNLKNVHLLPQQGANVQSILKCDILVLSKDALHHLEARLS